MNNRLMISVAAIALIAGTSFANAQGNGMSRETLHPPATPLKARIVRAALPAAKPNEPRCRQAGNEVHAVRAEITGGGREPARR